MVSKRGWIKIVEASIAIFIIFGVLLVVSNQGKIRNEKDYVPYLNSLLEEIAKNVTLREEIINSEENKSVVIEEFLSRRIALRSFGYDHKICQINDICGLEVYPLEAEEIYSADRVISSTINSFNPKKIKLFLWRKKS